MEVLDSKGQSSQNVFQNQRRCEYREKSEVCLSHPSLCELKTGHHRRRLNLNVCVGFLLQVRVGFGVCLEVIFDRTALSTCFCAPSIRCVCSCGRQVHRSGSAFTVGLSGRPGSPPAGCKSTNVASWRILLLLYLRSVPPPMLCFMEMSGRSWGRRHWVPGKEFIF